MVLHFPVIIEKKIRKMKLARMMIYLTFTETLNKKLTSKERK